MSTFSGTVAVASLNEHCLDIATKLAAKLKLSLVNKDDQTHLALLLVTETHLALQLTETNAPGPIYVEFLTGSLAHRRSYGGGKGQLIASAVGLKNKRFPTVVDVTAGLGKDAFVLATLGCNVTMVERNLVIVALLRDGLNRGQKADWFRHLKLRLIEDDAKNYLHHLQDLPDVIYLDPMFPTRTKSALVKKDMRILQRVIGEDRDSTELLSLALKKSSYRVVVKRPRHAPCISGRKPDLVYEGKSCRYDVYLAEPSLSPPRDAHN